MKTLKTFISLILLLCISLSTIGCSFFSDKQQNYGQSTSSSSSSNTSSNISSNEEERPDIEILDSYSYSVRKSEVTITDSGRKNQKMDHIPLSDDFSISDLKSAGYKSLKVTVTFNVKEVDDGYQYVFIYKDTSCNSKVVQDVSDIAGLGDDSLLYTHKFEHGAGVKNPNWVTETFTATISISSVKKDLYLRYGASGKYEDSWSNKNVNVTVKPYK